MKKRYLQTVFSRRGVVATLGLALTATVGGLYLNNQPDSQAEYFNKMAGLSSEELKEVPKYDRPDMALLQDFEMTKDPSLGVVPVEKKVSAYREVRNMINRRGSATAKAIDNVKWTERGPNNVGGRTRALMFDPNDASGQKVWAGGVAGGLWYNNNVTSNTSQWTAVDNFWANIAISTIAYDPANTQTFYVGTGEGFFNADAVRGAGIWKSTNGGSAWSQLTSTNNADFHYVQKLAVTANGTVLAATRTGLFRSTNGGSSWSRIISGRMADIEVAANGNIYVSQGIFTDGSVHKSTNDGVSFTAITPATGGQRIELASAPSNGNVVYAVASSGSNVAWFRKSTDGGNSWTSVTIPKYLNQNCSASSNDFTRGQAWYDLILAVHPTNPQIVLVGGIDIHKSTNGGSSWSSVSYWTGSCAPYLHADQHAITFRPGFPNEAIFGNDGGVSYSSNVGSATNPSFSNRNNGYNVTQFYAVAAANNAGSNYFLAGAQDNGSHKFTTAGINSTSSVTGGDGAFCHIDQDNSNFQITSYVYNVYYRSTNGGASFSNIMSDQQRGRFINPTDYDDTANKLYAAGNANELVRLDNITGSVSNAVVSVNINSAKISAVKVSPFTANRVFVGTDKGDVYRIDNAHTSSPTVTDISSSSFPNGYVSCVQIGSSDSQVMITFSNYGVTSVWESRNAGSTWANKEGNLPDFPVRWALYNPENTNQVLLATELCVWSVDDVSVSSPVWEVSNTGLANVRCDMLQYRSSDKLVSLATHGRGVFTSDVFSGTTPPPPACSATVSNFPYNESFESGLGAWTQDGADDIDWTRQSGATGSSNTGPASATDGSYYMYVEASSPNYPSKVTNLLSPCYNLDGLTSPKFAFEYHMLGSAMGTLNLQISEDSGNNWSTIWTKSGDQGGEWLSADVDLAGYTGVVKFRFNATTGSNYTSDIAIDKLTLDNGTVLPPACSSEITAFPYSEGFESGIGVWTQSSDDDIDWTRRLGTTPSSNTGPTSANSGSYYLYVEASSPNYPSKTADLESPCFNVAGLNAPTMEFAYHMYGAAMGRLNLQASTDNGATWATIWTKSGDQGNAWQSATVDLAAYSGVVKFKFNATTGSNYTSDITIDDISIEEYVAPIEYCTAGSSSAAEEWIQRVTVGTIDNNSGTNAGYADFTSLSTDMAKGSQYSITIYPAWAGTVYQEAYAVWIDYNKDGVFSDNGERVYAVGASTSGSVTGTFTVPASALSGATTMRVAMRYNAVPASCGSFNYGEVEDYTVNIQGGATMPQLAQEIGDMDNIKVHAYPNPMMDKLSIDLRGFSGEVSVKLIDTRGQAIRTVLVDAEQSVSMNVEGLKSGLYILVVQSNDKTMKQPIYKN